MDEVPPLKAPARVQPAPVGVLRWTWNRKSPECLWDGRWADPVTHSSVQRVGRTSSEPLEVGPAVGLSSSALDLGPALLDVGPVLPPELDVSGPTSSVCPTHVLCCCALDVGPVHVHHVLLG
eukprot:Mycagemm_TRINITY_DN10387_c0_g3::TRINITY_DN10387_c0_g3_i5::g.494::m.494 type:complete len:122 gc:universal TRINITY_DN10387_c0_g3_i5:1271-906(-)